MSKTTDVSYNTTGGGGVFVTNQGFTPRFVNTIEYKIPQIMIVVLVLHSYMKTMQ